MSLKNQISELIEHNHSKKVLELLRQHLSTNNSLHKKSYEQQIVQLSSRFHKISTDDISGLLTQEQAKVKMARWNRDILTLVDFMESDQPIPKKKKKKNSIIIYFLVMFALIGGGYFAWDMMRHKEDTLLCPQFSKDVACKLMVSDFNYDKDDFANINQLISDEINSNPDLNRWIQAKYANHLDDIKNGQKISDEALLEHCAFDYKVFGSLLKSVKGNRLTINVLPRMNFETRNYQSKISDLTELADQIQSVDLHQLDTSFIISKVCLACAMKSDEVVDQLMVVASNFKIPEKKQLLLNSLVTVSLVKKDTSKSIQILDEISNATPNDFALGALDEKSKLEEDHGDYSSAFLTQTRFIEETENRLQNPNSFRSKKSKVDLKKIQSAMRYQRGLNVIKNYHFLKKDKSIDIDKVYKRALHDFKILKLANFDNNTLKLERHIKELHALRKPNTIPEPQVGDGIVTIPIAVPKRRMTTVFGNIKSCRGAESIFFEIGNHKFKSDKKGQFNRKFMAFERDTLELSSPKWDITPSVIVLDNPQKNVQIRVKPKNLLTKVKETGRILDAKGNPISNVNLMIDKSKVKVDPNGNFNYIWRKDYCDKKSFAVVSIRSKIYKDFEKKMLLNNHKPWVIRLEKKINNNLIRKVSGSVVINIKGCKLMKYPVVYANSQPLKLDNSGHFSESMKKPSTKIDFSVTDPNWKLSKKFKITGRGYQLFVVPLNTNKRIHGKVLDKKKRPMIGVNIMIDGTSVGTVTDRNGNFTLNGTVNPCTQLSIQYNNFKHKNISIQKYFKSVKTVEIGTIFL